MITDNKTYDRLKYIAQIVLPGLGALYFSLAGIWGLPEPDKVVGTITVIDVFLGLLLKRSSDKYDDSDEKFDGSIDIQQTEEAETVSLGLNSDPEELENKDEVLLKVNKDEADVKLEEVKVVVETPKPKKRAPRKKT